MLAYYRGCNDGMAKILHGNISNASQWCTEDLSLLGCYTKSLFATDYKKCLDCMTHHTSDFHQL